MNTMFHTLVKAVKVALALLMAMALVYRGNTYLDPRGPNMLVPVMCIVLAMLTIGSTLALIFRSQSASA